MLSLIRKPTALSLAKQEEQEVSRTLLACHSALDYARSMVLYNEDRLERLRAYIESESARNDDLTKHKKVANGRSIA